MQIRKGFIRKRQLRTVGPNDSVARVIHLLKKEPPVGSVLVLMSGKLGGIITRRDVNLLPSKKLNPKTGAKAKDVMTSARLITVTQEASKEDILDILNRYKIEQVPVIDKNFKPIDVVSIKDIRSAAVFCFVLMPFKQPYSTIFKDHIARSLRAKFKLSVAKADDFFKPGPIIDTIQFMINKADILIADVTERNANVYYEIGYAHALKKTLILITQNISSLPFDLAHLRCIGYEYNPRGMISFEANLVSAVKSILDSGVTL